MGIGLSAAVARTGRRIVLKMAALKRAIQKVAARLSSWFLSLFFSFPERFRHFDKPAAGGVVNAPENSRARIARVS
jgi:hypothetical protein